ncbi:hypothetical protein L0657_10870 [Dyadobacter sp. CY345]|uniref:hypothetical protein n=1 Tax=Dyadobacter sp. CY345 TaxID=2909335 RepID=UPI001F1D613F|nr:hypothetical protein [Dyadobacter sp. CY345]MCF2444458.1 hypothetical protein [Dyadobacter sp. CY345]
MKNFRKIFAAALCGLLLTNLVSAEQLQNSEKGHYYESFRVGMYRVKNSLVMNLLLEKDKGVSLNIRLIDSNGKILHQEYVAKGLRKVGQKFDFSDVNDGDYRIEILNGDERVVKNISLSTTEIAEVSGRRLIAFN